MKSGIVTAMVLVMGIGGMTVSCEKEQWKPVDEPSANTGVHTKFGGDDDDDPVIRGKVKKSSGLVVNNALVETFTYGSGIKAGSTYTDTSGTFGQKVPVGIYYLKVTNPNSGIPVYTDTLHVNRDVEVNIIAD